MICRKRKLIFVHIPKCGGTSLENEIWPDEAQRTPENLWMGFTRPMHNAYQTGGLQHLTARLVRQVVGKQMFADCFKFAIVRHPLNRLVSQFKYMEQRADLREFAGLPPRFDFSTYLDHILRTPHVQWTPQNEFLLDADGSLLVNKTYRLEELNSNFEQFRRDIGLDIVLRHDNKTAHVAAPEISPRDKARVLEFYSADYDLLGYER